MARWKFQGTTKDQSGRILPSATISVYLAGTTTPASVYTSVTSTTAVNSITSSSPDATYAFYTDSFDYDHDQAFKIIITKPSYTSVTYDNLPHGEVVLGTYTISTAKIVTTYVKVPKGVVYAKSGSGSLTFNGGFEAGRYQVFSGFTGVGTDITFAAAKVEEVLAEWTGSGTTPTTTAAGRALLDDASAVAQIATLGLDTDIATLILPANTTISVAGAALIDDADAAAQRTTLGLGSDSLGGFFTSGRVLWIYENTAPTGWTIVAACADTVLAVKGGANAYNVNGGNQAGTWTQTNHLHTTGDFTLTTNEMPAHTHVFTDINVAGSNIPPAAGGGNIGSGPTGSTGGGAAHNHGNTGNSATANTWRPAGSVGIVISKD